MYHRVQLSYRTRALDLLIACLGSDEMRIRFVATQTAVFTPHTGLFVLPVDFSLGSQVLIDFPVTHTKLNDVCEISYVPCICKVYLLYIFTRVHMYQSQEVY